MLAELKILSTKFLPSEIKKELSMYSFMEIEVIRIERNEEEEKAFLDFLQRNKQDKKLVLLVTSKNALPSLSRIAFNPFDRVYCVGKKTASLLHEQTGWDVDQTARTARSLTKWIPERIEALVYPCSEQRMDTIPKYCRKNGIVLHEFQVYRPVPVEIVQKLEPDIIAFFSPSGVRAYYEQRDYLGETTLAIGPTTGKALKEFSQKIVVSEEASLNGMVKKIKQLYSSKKNT